MNIKDCILGAVVAAAIFAGANADTPRAAPVHAPFANMPAPGIAALRVCVGRVLDVVGTVAALAKQL